MKPDLQLLCDDLRQKYQVVGAILAVMKDGAVETSASGTLNLNTQIPCTIDSVFQIGSISKVFTATLIMQIVEEGRLHLDNPVIDYIPEFALADMTAAQTVTTRQLLNHTCGIDGDFFPADDPDGPSTASYIRKMCLLQNLYAPGQGPMTYSNSGFVVAGRLVEIMTGMTWQRAVMERICKPLGMPAVFAQPHESLRFRCAMGHLPDSNDPTKMALPAETFLPISMAPAGTVLSMSAESLLLFAQAHLADGECNGHRLLGRELANSMRNDAIAIAPFSRQGITHWGLGWFIGRSTSCPMAGHDGGTRGQFAYLRTFPEHKVAFTLLTNSPSDQMFREVEQHLMRALLGSSIPEDPQPEFFEPRPDRYTGKYGNLAASYQVTCEGPTLRLRFASSIGTIREFQAALKPYRHDTFEIQSSNTSFDGYKISFLGANDNGGAIYIRFGLRMGRRDAARV